MAATGDEEAEMLLRLVVKGHRPRLGAGGRLYLIAEPWLLLSLIGIGLLGKMLGRDPDVTVAEWGLGPDAAASGFAEQLWEIRQRAMYVDWIGDHWSSPKSITGDELLLLTRVASQLLRLARRRCAPPA
jgi:hypothetical protein